MRLHAIVHMGVPAHGAGAEHYLQDLFRWLVGRGHEATVHVSRASGEWEVDGVRYAGGPTLMTPEVTAADLLVTHLDMTRQAVRLARQVGKPLAHLCHNDRQLAFHRVRPADCALAIFNSRWVARASKWRGPRIVLPPPVFADRYVTGQTGDAITLMNLMESKGGPLFFELARRMPERRFLGVRGAYGKQEIPKDVPANVTILDNQPDVTEVYRQTHLLLMPSAYESWGRCAVEAAASGIPTIAHPTPGLLESVGPCAVFCDRDDPDQWVRAIMEFDSDTEYGRSAIRAMQRSRELDPPPGLEALEVVLRGLVPEDVPVEVQTPVV